ncbi:Phosphoenolpyruvate carboxykinase [Bienertia sinuspersici]
MAGDEAPFSGLIICASGLSKEARKQVMEGTERLGAGSPSKGIESLGGSKLKHALKHGLENGPFVVTLGWFIDSMKENVKLSELPYTTQIATQVNQMEDRLLNVTTRDTCIPMSLDQNRKQFEESKGQKQWFCGGVFEVNKESHLFGQVIYIDLDVSSELYSKVVDVAAQEGAMLVDRWFVGCGANYVVCEGSSIQSYLGHIDNIVSPIWVLKTYKERSMLRFAGLSADLARQVGVMLENNQHTTAGMEKCHEHNCDRSKVTQKERQQVAKLAKCGVKNRRARRLQSCHVPLRPINPSSLLESICWSISEPISTAAVFADSLLSRNDTEFLSHGLSVEGDYIVSEASFSNTLRPLTESEKNEVVFRNHFLAILYPVDRFAELGPSSRTYFSDTGFTCLQLLEFIYAFYQENMSSGEIEVAIHTDSRHADQLRSVYCSKRTEELGYVTYKRIEFMGSRKSFEMLKRISGDNNSNVYELITRE